jgi:hypothetical protein
LKGHNKSSATSVSVLATSSECYVVSTGADCQVNIWQCKGRPDNHYHVAVVVSRTDGCDLLTADHTTDWQLMQSISMGTKMMECSAMAILPMASTDQVPPIIIALSGVESQIHIFAKLHHNQVR